MEEHLKKALKLELMPAFPGVDIDRLLQDYEEFCQLETPVEKGVRELWLHDLDHFYQMSEFMRTCHVNLIGSESFFKKVLYVVDEATYKLVTTEEGRGLRKTLASIGVLKSLPNKFDIAHGNYEELKNPLQRAIVQTYQLRNDDSHSSDSWALSEMFQNIKSVIIATAHAVWNNRAKLEEACRKHTNNTQYGIEAMMREIKKAYQKKMSSGFKYVPLLWEAEQKNGEKTQYRHIDINELKKDQQLILLGDAGCGKTTSLEYLQFQDADNYIKGASQCIPALLNMDEEEADTPLMDMICRCLNIPMDYCETLLGSGLIHVFVDGINELTSDAAKKKSFVMGLEKFMERHPNTLIVLTDRRYSPIQVNLKNKYLLKKMAREDILLYAGSQPGWNQDIEKKLNSYLDQKEFSGLVYTPLLVNQLMMAASSGMQPEDGLNGLIAAYLEGLIHREYEEKRELNAQPGKLDLCLMCLATLCVDENGVPLLQAMNECVKIMNKYGSQFNPYECISLARQLGILKQSGGNIDFVLEEYRIYFLDQAFKINL